MWVVEKSGENKWEESGEIGQNKESCLYDNFALEDMWKDKGAMTDISRLWTSMFL